MGQGQTLASFAAQLLPPKPTGPAPVLPQTLGKRPKPMTLAEVIKAAILGGGMGMPSPYENDYGYERAAAAGEGLGLGLPMMAGALSKGGQTLSQVVKQGIKAYHGSPHDFDQFSLSKIGTGEGVQAYGHGLYFAENPGVANQYKESLGTLETVIGGERVWPADPRFEAASHIAAEGYDTALAMAERGATEKFLTPEGRQHSARLAEQIKSLKDAPVATRPTGKMYEVDIKAHPDDFLDWDKPLSQQSEKVRKALEKSGMVHGQEDKTAFMARRQKAYDDHDAGRITVAERNRILSEEPKRTWDEPANAVIRGASGAGGEQAQISEKLKAAGIKGIRYLDQGSRAVGGQDVADVVRDMERSRARLAAATTDKQRQLIQADVNYLEGKIKDMRESAAKGTSNYVVFDDAIIDIMKKYGLAFPAAAALLQQQQNRSKRGEAHASAQ